MKIYTLFLVLILSALSFTCFSAELEVEPQAFVALGVRGGTNNDINDKPAVYVGGKMSYLFVGTFYNKVHFLVPGLGVQTGNSSTKINLSIAPIMFSNSKSWSFGVDIFANTDTAKSGRSNFGFFIGKGF